MSKKRTGLLIALGAVLGAAAAGVAYYLKYKSFNDELDKDFHDYEEEDVSGEEKKDEPVPCQEAAGRNYITLDSAKCRTEENAPENEEQPSCEPDEEAGCPADEPDEEESRPVTKEAGEAAPSTDPAENPVRPSADVTVEEDTEGETA